MGEEHARLSPSNHAWPHCPGSIRECEKYPDIPNDAAIDGTGSHILLEQCLIQNKLPVDFKGVVLGVGHHDKPKGWLIDTDRIKRVDNVIAYIDRRKRELAEKFKGFIIKVLAESKSNPGRFCGRDDWHGTADITIIVENINGRVKFVEIVDLKDGRMFVPVKDNSQLLSYLAGKVFELSAYADEYRMTIIQPKTNPMIRYEDVNNDTLVIRYRRLEQCAKATDEPNAPLVPDGRAGKGWCRWCKHRENCEALNQEVISGMTKVIKEESPIMKSLNETVKSIEEMTGEELSEFLKTKKSVMDRYAQAEKEAETRLKNGQSVGHYRMKPGSKERIWNCKPEEIAKILQSRGMRKDEIYPSKFISVPQALNSKTLTEEQKKNIEEKYVSLVDGKPRLGLMSSEEIQDYENNEVMNLMREAAQKVKQTQEFSFL